MSSQQGDKLASSEGPFNPFLHNKAEKYCITCGESNSISLCSRCKGVWYCNDNKKCQRADWPCHKLLCSKYSESNEVEPLDNAYRAFLFRTDSLKPEMVILPTSWHRTYDMDPVRELFRRPGDREYGPSVDRCGFGFICRLNDRLMGKHSVQVIYRDCYKLDGSKANKSILASVRAVGTAYPPNFWAGNIIVRRIQSPSDRPKSATMADFRHAIDWLAMYPQHQFYQGLQAPPTGLASPRLWVFDDIKGVMIAGDQHTKDESERYRSVTVPYNHAIRGLARELRGDISPISERIGRPLRLIMLPTTSREPDADDRLPTCDPVSSLMRRLKKDANGRAPYFAFSLPKGTAERGHLPFMDGALVVSADDKDLSINEVKAMAHFSESVCREVIRDVTLTPPGDNTRLEAAMQKALDFMNWDNYLLAFDELDMPRPERPTEEAFVDMRGIGTRDTPDDPTSRGTDEEDDWTESEDDCEDESDF